MNSGVPAGKQLGQSGPPPFSSASQLKSIRVNGLGGEELCNYPYSHTIDWLHS